MRQGRSNACVSGAASAITNGEVVLWFPLNGNKTTGLTCGSVRTYAIYAGHCDSGPNCLYTQNGNFSLNFHQEFTSGTPPVNDGDPWTGTVTNVYGTTALTQEDVADNPPCPAWNQ